MSYTLYKKIESNGRGSPEDDSEHWTDDVSFILVRFDEEDDFQESMASDYGSQDYYYSVTYKRVMELSDEELTKLFDCVKEKLFIKNLKEDRSD